MRVFLNALGASAGAGLTYLYNVVPQLTRTPGLHTTLAVQPNLQARFDQLPNLDLFSPPRDMGAARRFWFEQQQLPAIIERSGADILISAGNFALRKSPIPQILLSGNSLYTSREFYRDLLSRREWRMLIGTVLRGHLAKRSVWWSDCTFAPSRAFADDLRSWTGRETITTLHHGFDPARFFRSETRLPGEIEDKLGRSESCLRLLFVSHYNYYRNFETLLRALPFVQKRIPQRRIKLFLTCKLEAHANPGGYDVSRAARLVHDLAIRDSVEELGAVPYDCLSHLYRTCDMYVTAAYAETFAHPLVEAMASGLPVVASDLLAHREVCGDAALYFAPFDSEKLADSVWSVAADPDVRSRMVQAAVRRAADFSWSGHVQSLLQIADELRRTSGAGVQNLCPIPIGNHT